MINKKDNQKVHPQEVSELTVIAKNASQDSNQLNGVNLYVF